MHYFCQSSGQCAGGGFGNTGEGKRRLSLKARLVGDALCIEVENTFAGEVKEAKGRLVTTKEKAEGHGYGLRSVRDVVELYGGHIQISHEDGIFRVTIWIGHLSGAAA